MAEQLLAGFAQKAATAVGVAPEKVQSMIKQAEEIMADGKVTPQEVEMKIAEIARAHGVPANLIDTAVSMVMGHINSTKK
jgi:hypothetical protein